MSKKNCGSLVLAIFVFSGGLGTARLSGQDQIEKAKIYRDTYPIVVEADLYCAIFMLEGEIAQRILAPASGERLLLSDADQFWGGPAGDWREGRLLQIVEVGPSVPGIPGNLAYGRGRAKIMRLEGDRFLARIEKSCGPIRLGDRLLPFEKKDILQGKDLGYGGTLQGGEVLTGRVVFLADDRDQIGANGYALIDIGRERGLQPGRQLTVFSPPSGNEPARAIGNAVVIDAGRATATIKVLSLKDSIRAGNLVQVK